MHVIRRQVHSWLMNRFDMLCAISMRVVQTVLMSYSQSPAPRSQVPITCDQCLCTSTCLH